MADEVAAMYRVQAMPTFLSIKDGNIVDKVQGADITGLYELIDKLDAACPDW